MVGLPSGSGSWGVEGAKNPTFKAGATSLGSGDFHVSNPLKKPPLLAEFLVMLS